MSLENIIKQFSEKRILVIGDIMLDHYIWGDVERISPEAPVPVVHVDHDTFSAGGAANVALNLANLGVNTSLLGYYTNDSAGQQLVSILSVNNIKLVTPPVDSSVPTIIKTRVIIRGQQLCRIDREQSPSKYELQLDSFEKMLLSEIELADAVIISDYAKGIITQKLIDLILSSGKFKKGHLLVAVDPKPSNKINYKGVGLLTPNRSEALQMADLPALNSKDDYPLEEICTTIYNKYNPDTLVITLGAEGMAVCKKGKVISKLKTEARQVFDVSGAGDTVIALITAAITTGANEIDAANIANVGAGCVVSHVGTSPITLIELLGAISKYQTKA